MLAEITARNSTGDADKARALAFRNDINDIWAIAWGIPVGVSPLGPLQSAALDDMTTNGRNGKGNVIVTRSGDQGREDNCSALLLFPCA